MWNRSLPLALDWKWGVGGTTLMEKHRVNDVQLCHLYLLEMARPCACLGQRRYHQTVPKILFQVLEASSHPFLLASSEYLW